MKLEKNAESRFCNLSCCGFPRNNSRFKEDFEDVNEERRFAETTPNTVFFSASRHFLYYTENRKCHNINQIYCKIFCESVFKMQKMWWTFYIVPYITQFCGFHLPPWNLPNRVLGPFDLWAVSHQY